jgi:hypothetical protein
MTKLTFSKPKTLNASNFRLTRATPVKRNKFLRVREPGGGYIMKGIGDYFSNEQFDSIASSSKHEVTVSIQ